MFLGNHTLRDAIEAGKLIEKAHNTEIKFDKASVELHLGEDFFHSAADKFELIKLSKEVPARIPAGQVALLCTAEKVKIPNDLIAFISIKSKYKLQGLINVSGFHVDPGYEGGLVFSVYNSSNRDITLRYNDPVFIIWFAKLDQAIGKDAPVSNPKSIDGHLMDNIKGQVATPRSLQDEIDKLRKDYIVVDYLIKAALTVSIGLMVSYFAKCTTDSTVTQLEILKYENATLKSKLEQIESKVSGIKVVKSDSTVH